jgi:hypothetical protein
MDRPCPCAQSQSVQGLFRTLLLLPVSLEEPDICAQSQEGLMGSRDAP